jgi:predicted DsbA family dithiol-disulfide isomerase
MGTPIKIDFVSDVSCPWCAIGLKSLEQAVARLGDAAQVEWHFQPFELNPGMAPQGLDIHAYFAAKLGLSPEQVAQSAERLRARGAEVGFTFGAGKRSRVYNTFDAHRLLHWAELQGAGAQHRLKMALLEAYFTRGEDLSSHQVLADAAEGVGLDRAAALAVLASQAYAAEVREREQFYQRQGIASVPAIIINERHLISGGQPPEVFEGALREIMARSAA